ncbi:heme o synthase [Stutzerimonas azotifigens]|uniref:Protoheme IX farnesyltransferase n=1 Tax=Stutzerimonas azotifigens TaxID=291995 RepID=A0ABR5YYT9_9GAMM|nr:heme o synthase [Stutzerimonas azotifigens]MBA1273063.1 protoheme IX farnesyltransferase [Stutzerimonas azotifigens]
MKPRGALGHFIQVTKPGIIFGNAISVAGGYFLAARGAADLWLLLVALLGTALVVASGCAFNNYIDRDIDVMMERTRNRVLVQGLLPGRVVLAYATVLGLAGVSLLYWGANPLSALFAVLGFVIYVGFYSLYLKRKSVHGTLVGSISGAMPPVIGYCAASGSFDLAALTLLIIFSLWQVPHSYAIAIFRYKDYLAASIPVLPVERGIAVAKRHILLYILAFLLATLMLALWGYAGISYLVVAAAMGSYWLYLAWTGYQAVDDRLWARKLFFFSIYIITALSLMMAVDVQRTGQMLLSYAG